LTIFANYAFANVPNFLFSRMQHYCALLDVYYGSIFSCFYGFIEIENDDRVK